MTKYAQNWDARSSRPARGGWIEKDPSSTDLIKTLRKLISLWERDLIEKNTATVIYSATIKCPGAIALGVFS